MSTREKAQNEAWENLKFETEEQWEDDPFEMFDAGYEAATKASEAKLDSQEPVAYTSTKSIEFMHKNGEASMWFPFDNEYLSHADEIKLNSKQIPLYTSPQPDLEAKLLQAEAQIEALQDKIHNLVGEDSEQIRTCCCNWDAKQICKHHSPLLMQAEARIKELSDDIKTIKEKVVGDKYPNWVGDMVTVMRSNIADICDYALSTQPSTETLEAYVDAEIKRRLDEAYADDWEINLASGGSQSYFYKAGETKPTKLYAIKQDKDE